MARDFGDPARDWIPDRILAEFQHDAAMIVRRSRRKRRWGPGTGPLGSSEVWWATFVVVCGLVAGGGLIGGLGYAVVVWPWVGLLIVVPALVLTAVSFVTAARTRQRTQEWSLW